MHYLKILIGGLIGGAIGGAVWVAIGYSTGYEVGWIAWGVGFAVGLAVRIATQDEDGDVVQGIAAAALALLAILASKYLVYSLVVGGAIAKASDYKVERPHEMIAQHADGIVEEYEAAGKRLNYPPGHDFDDATWQQQYPADVWQLAEKRWQALSAEEQEAAVKQREELMKKVIALMINAQLGNEVSFTSTFSPWDALWFGLAAFTAFRVGSGTISTGDD